MNYFGEQVMKELAELGIQIPPSEQLAYVAVCEQNKKIKKEVKIKKNPQQGRKYSLWHLPNADKELAVAHWLILPGRPHWDAKNFDVVPKLALNISTGEKMFLKIRRPMGEFYETPHVNASILEAYNNQRLGVRAKHYQRNTINGFKAYLFQPYDGDTNVLEMIQKGSTTPKQILALLSACGNALYKIHQSGFMHNDFALQNVAYDPKTQTVSIVDLEQMLTVEEGQKGLREVHIRVDHLHPEWLLDATERSHAGKRFIFTPQNDVYAFLTAADMALQEASLRPESPEFIHRLHAASAQIRLWKAMPFEKLPALKDVLQFIHKLDVEPEQRAKRKTRP